MSNLDLILVAISLAMDAFAVSICKGLSVQRVSVRHMLACGLWFGGFQAAMPLLGYLSGAQFAALFAKYGAWVAFALLLIIGVGMIHESMQETEKLGDDFSPAVMLPLAVATSIDAFAVGVGFAAVPTNLPLAISSIGVVTCLLCMAGVQVGAVFGCRFRATAERAGGVVLILIGLKTLLTGLGVI